MLINLFPLNTVLLPGSTIPLNIFEPRYLEMVRQCEEKSAPIGIILLRKGTAEGLGPIDLYDVGTTAEIIDSHHREDGTIGIRVIGRDRFIVRQIIQWQPRALGEVDLLHWNTDDLDTETLKDLKRTFGEYWQRLLEATGQWTNHMLMPEEPEALVEFIASQLQIDTVQKQRLLEEKSLGAVIKLQLTTLQMHIPKLIRARTARDQRSNN